MNDDFDNNIKKILQESIDLVKSTHGGTYPADSLILSLCTRLHLMQQHANKLAGGLAEAAGYLASVRTDRKIRDQHGDLYVGQTPDWAEGAKEYAAKANELLEAHDGLSCAKTEPAPLDWKAVQLHLEDVERAYRMLIGIPGVNPSFMLDVLDRLRGRFNRGERTPELHAEIMAIEE